MIDLHNEEILAVRDVPSVLPKRPNGKKLHISAVYRWISRGVRGVRLESTKVGGSTYTSVEALQRFADKLNGSSATDDSTPPTMRAQRQTASRAQAILRMQGHDGD